MDPDTFIFITQCLLNLADTATLLTISFCNYTALGMKKMMKANFTIMYYLNSVCRQIARAVGFIKHAAEELCAHNEEEQQREASDLDFVTQSLLASTSTCTTIIKPAKQFYRMTTEFECDHMCTHLNVAMEVDMVEQSALGMDVDVSKGGNDDVEMKDGGVEMTSDGDIEMKEVNVEETEVMENIGKDNGEHRSAIEGFNDIDNSFVMNTADSDDIEMSDGRVDSD
ncbi:hypothetical protein F5887DRAFT_915165 [Amanita rubescens]|nr:hypothetical protein F5887DRAFT_915165 [Amanita rubescens]